MSKWHGTVIDGVVQRFIDGGHGDTFHVERLQDVEAILERNKALRNHDDGFNSDRSGRRVASVPMIVWEMWIKEGMDPTNPGEFLKRKLNDPDFAYLRTSEGRI